MSSTKGSKKCYSCGKMASKPYTFTVVPPTGVYGKQKAYIKSGEEYIKENINN